MNTTQRFPQPAERSAQLPRESQADWLKRRVYSLICLLGLPGVYTAWFASRNEQPFMANAYICLGVGVLYAFVQLLNRRVSVLRVERFGFAMTVVFVLTNLIHTNYFAAHGPVWREARETSQWLIAYTCVVVFVFFETRMGLRIATGIVIAAFLLGLLSLPMMSANNSNEFISLIRYTSVSTAMLGFTYLLAYTKEQLNLERVRSSTDDLTGLTNRRALYALLENKILEAKTQASSVSVILLDVDEFKKINDTYGHTAGDQVLIEFSDLLKQGSPHSANVGRWGGEEFLLIIPANLEAAVAYAESLRVRLEQHPFELGHVTASFGVAHLYPDEQSNDLIRRADLALYAAKSRGRNRVEHQVRLFDQLEGGFEVASAANVELLKRP